MGMQHNSHSKKSKVICASLVGLGFSSTWGLRIVCKYKTPFSDAQELTDVTYQLLSKSFSLKTEITFTSGENLCDNGMLITECTINVQLYLLLVQLYCSSLRKNS